MNPANIEMSVDIDAPPQTVWAVIADPERWHEWTPSIRSIRLLDKGPLAIGTRGLVRQPKLPPAVWTVTAIDPGRRFTWKSSGPGFAVFGDHSVDPIAGGARATLGVRYEGLFGPLLARLTRAITTRYVGYEAVGLKQRSEAFARTQPGR